MRRTHQAPRIACCLCSTHVGPCHRGAWGADAETEAAAGEMLEIELKVDAPRSCSWSIDRWHILVAGSSVTSLLVRLREEFDGRRAGPGARMEAAM